MAETRVTGGEFRGRVIVTPRGLAVRPTRAMVRQSLFNILGARVTAARVLDLYAGAGSLGFEALSRGADHATFVDRDPHSLRAIGATAERFGCADRCRVVMAEARRYVTREAASVRGIDICFVDAPYRDPELDALLAQLGLDAPALVVCEHHERRVLPERIGALTSVREVRHGLTSLTLLQRESEDAGA